MFNKLFNNPKGKKKSTTDDIDNMVAELLNNGKSANTDRALLDIEKLFKRVANVENEKVDFLRLLLLYLNREKGPKNELLVKQSQLIKFLKK